MNQEEKDKFGYFQPSAKVTISSDFEGKHPLYTGFVKRLGNGQWRLSGTSEWFSCPDPKSNVCLRKYYNTVTSFAHPYIDGDEELAELEHKRLQKIEVLKCEIEKKKSCIESKSAYIKRCEAVAKDNVTSAEFALKRAEKWLEQCKNNLIREQQFAQKSQEEIKNLNQEIDMLSIELQEYEITK